MAEVRLSRLERMVDSAWTLLGKAWPLNIVVYALSAPLAELVFWKHSKMYTRVQSCTTHRTFAGQKDSNEALNFWETVLSESPAALERLMQSWFLGEGEVLYENAQDFVAWSIYNERAPLLLGAQKQHVVRSILSRLESALGRTFHPGRSETLRCMTYTLEGLTPCHKPLIWYLSIQSVHKMITLLLRAYGFHFYQAGRLSYYYRPSCGAETSSSPIVFLHGVLGLLPYVVLFHTLTRQNTAIFIPIFPEFSISTPPTVQSASASMNTTELVVAIRTMVTHHTAPYAVPRASFIGHSLGSGLLAAIIKAAPEIVASAAFSDPICFQLYQADVLHNFLYAEPPAFSPRWLHFFQRHLITLEPGIQSCFRRNFWWSHYWLHPEQLPCDALVFLSGNDSVASPSTVHEYLSSWKHQRLRDSEAAGKGQPELNLEVHYHEHWQHGWLMFHRKQMCHMIQTLGEMASASVARDAGNVGDKATVGPARAMAGVRKTGKAVEATACEWGLVAVGAA